MKLPRQEINRKLLHLLGLGMPVGIYYLPVLTDLPLWAPPLALGILLFLLVLTEALRLTHPNFQQIFGDLFKKMLRKNEDQHVTGATYLIAGAFLCSLIFIDSPHISFIVLTLFILGDSAASLVGKSFGRLSLFSKSIEGSLACFVLCLILSTMVFPHLPHLSAYFEKEFSLAMMFIVSLSITLLELLPVRLTDKSALNDNLYVPPAAGLLLYALTGLLK